MADKTATMDVEKQEVSTEGNGERTRDCTCFVPRADIYEVDEQIVIVADVPGADENSVDIVIEKNVLTINAYVNSTAPEGMALNFAEYEVGDYTRSFKLPDEIDQEKIEATVKDGVLRLYLPKAVGARTRKISVKAA